MLLTMILYLQPVFCVVTDVYSPTNNNNNKMFLDSDPVSFTTSDSFLSLPKWDAVRNGSLFLKFRTNEANGVLVYSHGVKNSLLSEQDSSSLLSHHRYHHPSHDYFGIELLGGHVFFLMNLGSGPIKVKATMKRIDDGHWHSIRVTREARSGRVSVDEYSVGFIAPASSHSSPSSSSSHYDLDLEGSLFIGSVGTTGFLSSPETMMSPPPELWAASLGYGFVGCVRDLILNNDLLVNLTAYAVDQDTGGVKLGCHSSSASSPTFNKNHLCTQFSCLNEGVCREGWNRKVCHCQTTGFTGSRCGREALVVSFNGNQFFKITLPKVSVTQVEDLYVRFRSLRSSGLILVATVMSSSSSVAHHPSSHNYLRNYLIISLESSRLKVTLNLGDENKVSHFGYNLNDDLWHSVKIERRGPSLEIKLDGVNSVTEITGQWITLSIDTFFLGSLGSKKIEDHIFFSSSSSKLSSNPSSSLYQSLKDVPNFSGSLQSIIFNGVDMIESSRSGQMEGLFNSTAEVDFASEKDKIEFHLDSPVTFKSRKTFVALTQLPAFSKMSISFSFKTLSLNGLLLFNGGKRNHFVSLELENGQLVYSFNLGDGGGGRRLSSKARQTLNDNTWHSVSVQRTMFNHHSLRVDDQVFTLTSPGINTHLHLEGFLYLGGIPTDMYNNLPKVIKAGYGFEGCLADLDINNHLIDPSSPSYALIPSTLVSPGCINFVSLEEKRCTLSSCSLKGMCVNLPTTSSSGKSQGPLPSPASPSKTITSSSTAISSSFACDCDQSTFVSTSCSEEGASFRFGGDLGLINRGTSSPSQGLPPYDLSSLPLPPPMHPSGGIITVSFPEGNHMDTKSDSLSLGILTFVGNAVILRIDSSSSSDFMEMQLKDYNVLMIYNLGAEDHQLIVSGVNVSDGEYHSIKFERNGPNATLQVDNHNAIVKIPGGKQLTIFNSLAKIQVGGKKITLLDKQMNGGEDNIDSNNIDVPDNLEGISPSPPAACIDFVSMEEEQKCLEALQKSREPTKKEIPNFLFQGIISGVTYNGMKVLDLAADNNDERITVEGDVHLLTLLPKQFNPKNIHSLLNSTDRHVERKHMTSGPSHHRLYVDTDELILSKEGPQFCWDDNDCLGMTIQSSVSTTSSYDDLITPFLSGEKIFGGILKHRTKVVSCDQDEDDEDCSETGSGDGKKDDEEEEDDNKDDNDDDQVPTSSSSLNEHIVIWDPTSTTTSRPTESYEFRPLTSTMDSPRIVFKATISTTTEYMNPRELEQSYRPKSPPPIFYRPTNRPVIVDVPKPEGSNKPASSFPSDKKFLPKTSSPSSHGNVNAHSQTHITKTSHPSASSSLDSTSLFICITAGVILTIVIVAPITLFLFRRIDPNNPVNVLFHPSSGAGNPVVGTDVYASVNKSIPSSFPEGHQQQQQPANHIVVTYHGRHPQSQLIQHQQPLNQPQLIQHQQPLNGSISSGLSNGQHPAPGAHSPAQILSNPYQSNHRNHDNSHIVLPVNQQQSPHQSLMSPGGHHYSHHQLHNHQMSTMMPVNSSISLTGPQSILKKRKDNEWYV